MAFEPMKKLADTKIHLSGALDVGMSFYKGDVFGHLSRKDTPNDTAPGSHISLSSQEIKELAQKAPRAALEGKNYPGEAFAVRTPLGKESRKYLVVSRDDPFGPMEFSIQAMTKAYNGDLVPVHAKGKLLRLNFAEWCGFATQLTHVVSRLETKLGQRFLPSSQPQPNSALSSNNAVAVAVGAESQTEEKAYEGLLNILFNKAQTGSIGDYQDPGASEWISAVAQAAEKIRPADLLRQIALNPDASTALKKETLEDLLKGGFKALGRGDSKLSHDLVELLKADDAEIMEVVRVVEANAKTAPPPLPEPAPTTPTRGHQNSPRKLIMAEEGPSPKIPKSLPVESSDDEEEGQAIPLSQAPAFRSPFPEEHGGIQTQAWQVPNFSPPPPSPSP